MYELVAFDLDGTLVGDDNKLHPGVKEMVEKLRKKGVTVLLASGREHVSMEKFAKELGLTDAIISLNGAVIIDAQGKLLHRTSIRHDHLLAIRDALVEQPVFTFIFTPEKLLASSDAPELEMFKLYSHAEIEVHEDYMGFIEQNAIEKLLFVAEHDELERFKDKVLKRVPSGLNTDFSTSNFLEIYDATISKGAALEWLCKARGIPREKVVAVGDGENDITMLTFAGVGIAMGNAPEHVRASADMVADHHNADGVVKAIAKVFE